MKRDPEVYLRDILDSVLQCQTYVKGVNKRVFMNDLQKQDAVVRRLEIIGEAATRVPAFVRTKMPDVEWRKIVALRNVLIHEYSGVDMVQVWIVAKKLLEPLRKEIAKYLKG
jgi:uncharacterized protein with HEPN domain